jgi:hypothetical protein
VRSLAASGGSANAIRVAIRIGDVHVAHTIRVGLNRFVLDALDSEALKERVEPSDSERDPARTCPQCVRLDEEPGMLGDLPEDLLPGATVWGSPEEPRVPIDAGLAGHGLKDLWQHRRQFVANTRWWPPFCLVVDWVAAAIVEIIAGVHFHH